MTNELTNALGRELFVTATDHSSTGGDMVTRTVGPDEELGTALVMMVADVLDENPMELSPPLYELVDAEALDGLFAAAFREDADVSAELELYGCTITVESIARSRHALAGRRSAVDPPESRASESRQVGDS